MSSAGKRVSLRGVKAGLRSATASVRHARRTGQDGARRNLGRAGHSHALFGVRHRPGGAAGQHGLGAGWRDAEPKPAYDVVIIGGGGHGLATAYYLAKEHGITNVAVLEKGWLGCGNVGRNTTIVRSNYLLPGNIAFYEWSMKLWEGLEQDLNYNAMVSQRGVLNLYHSDAQRDAFARRGNAMRLHGVDAELLDRDEVRAMAPFLDFDNAPLPDPGRAAAAPRRHRAPRRCRLGLCARRRPARRRPHPELRGHRVSIEDGTVIGVETTRGPIRAGKVGMAGRRQFLARRRAWPACDCRSRATSCRPSSPRR